MARKPVALKKKNRWGKLSVAQVEGLLNEATKEAARSIELLREQRRGYAKLIRSKGMRKMCQYLPTLEQKLDYIASVIECD